MLKDLGPWHEFYHGAGGETGFNDKEENDNQENEIIYSYRQRLEGSNNIANSGHREEELVWHQYNQNDENQ